MRRIAQFRKDYNSILDNLMPEDERVAFCDNDVVNVLTNRDQLGRRVLIVNAGGKGQKFWKCQFLANFMCNLVVEDQKVVSPIDKKLHS